MTAQLADHRSLLSHRDDEPRAYACSTYDAAVHLGLLDAGADPNSKSAQSATRTVRNMLRSGQLYGYNTGCRWMVAHASIRDLLESSRQVAS